MKTLPLEYVMDNWRPGSYNPPWSWQQEADDIGGEMDWLMTSIQETGITHPVELGNDGRVWDGHHRIVAAWRLGITEIPVKIWREEEHDDANA